jgi:hypothetical protein
LIIRKDVQLFMLFTSAKDTSKAYIVGVVDTGDQFFAGVNVTNK